MGWVGRVREGSCADFRGGGSSYGSNRLVSYGSNRFDHHSTSLTSSGASSVDIFPRPRPPLSEGPPPVFRVVAASSTPPLPTPVTSSRLVARGGVLASTVFRVCASAVASVGGGEYVVTLGDPPPRPTPPLPPSFLPRCFACSGNLWLRQSALCIPASS